MDMIKTVGQYLDSRKEIVSKNKFDKLKKTLEGIPEETKVLWGYFPGKSEKAEDSDGKPATIDLISTIDVDRDNEVLIPEGCDLSGYKKTPTVLFGHNYNSIPVGVSKWQKIADRGINSRTEYFSSDFARDVHEAAINGALANSVGFIPTKWVDREENSEEYKQLVEKYQIKGKPKRIFTHWHLLEYSKVPVAANPHAITMAMKMAKTEQMKDWLKQELEEILEKRICGKRDLPVSDKEKWDGAAARKRIEAWATSGEDIDWKKYQQAFVYVDPESADTKGGYKLPFADIVDGKLTAVWGGVRAAMGALLGARGGVDIPDNERKPAYSFLVAYYKKLDKEPPEFREYAEEELGKMFPEESDDPALVECQNCHEKIDYGKEQEVTQGAIKCPKCGAIIDQTGKVQGNKPEKTVFYTRDESGNYIEVDEDIVKAGAVLNRKNKEALQKAQALIQEVLESSEGDDDDDKQKQTSEGKEKTDVSGPKTDDNSQSEADGIEGLDLNGSEIKPDGEKPETIEGLTFENPKPEEISEEDAKKIIAAMDAVFEKKVNRVLGKV